MTNEEFGLNVMSQVEWIERDVEKALENELVARGASIEQAREVSYLIGRLENDLSELAGSPDRNVAERFIENTNEFEKLLTSIVGKEAFEEMDIDF